MRIFALSLLALSWVGAFALSTAAPKHVSLVTGANGYVGRQIVHEILRSGRGEERVVCLVRPARVPEESRYWKSQDCVQVLPYDMLDGGRTLFDAIESCGEYEKCIVYHVASVFGPTVNHKQTALDNVKGSKDLVKTLTRFPRTKLVLTSSMAAVRGTGQTPANGKFYTYEDWNNLSELGANWGASYQWSKTESERQA